MHLRLLLVPLHSAEQRRLSESYLSSGSLHTKYAAATPPRSASLCKAKTTFIIVFIRLSYNLHQRPLLVLLHYADQKRLSDSYLSSEATHDL
jgi:hypothetical protein